MKYYLFNKNHLNEYLGEYNKFFKDCTTKVKPPEYQEHTLPCWNVQLQKWDKIIPDYRNMYMYLKINSLIKQIVDLAGEIDSNYTVVPPPSQDKRYVYQNNEWKQYIQPPVPQHKRTRCTKYQLIVCLTAYYPELLVALKTAYKESNDLQFYWSSVLNLDRNNQDFKTAVAKLGITDEQLDEIFAKIQGEEPTI